MALRDDRRVVVLEEVHKLELLAERARRRVEVVHNREIQLAALKARRGFHRLHLNDVQLDLGVAAVKGLDGRRHKRRARALECREPQAPGARLRVRGHRAFRLGDAPEDRVGVSEQQLARVGQPRTLAVAFDEHRARFALERRDLLADRRLRVRQRVGGRGERSVPRELA